MIKFFRKIRYDLIEKKETGKYLKYAIGEIILVVIGILIALQINNWNQSRKAESLELALYKTILDNVNDEYLNIDWHINHMKNYQNTHYKIYNESRGKVQPNSNIYYNSLQWVHPFNPIIHENYSVSLVNISNEKIREVLNTNISSENRAIDAYNEWNDFKIEHVRPFFRKYGIHNTERAFNDKPYDFMSLVRINLIERSKLKEHYGTIEFDEILFDLRFKTSWLIEKLTILEESNRQLAHALEQELEHNKIPLGKHQAKYYELKVEAENLYELKEYQQSAIKYQEAFEQGDVYHIDRYNAACSFALAKDIESAFNHLFELANGESKYKNYQHITSDTDLDILHMDKRWDELIAIVKLNHEETEKDK